MYHAGYKEASALNVVIGIDQLREFMLKKRRVPRASSEGPVVGAAERKRLEVTLGTEALPLFELGGLHVLAERSGDQLLYHLYGRNFPLDDRRLAVLEDDRSSGKFGEFGRLFVRGEGGWRAFATVALHEEDHDLLDRLGDAVRLHILRVLEYRRVLASKGASEERRRGRELLKTLERQAQPERELVVNFVELVERLAPGREGAPLVGGAVVDAGAPAAPPLRPERLTAHP
jgi:hypothetical protein